MTFDENQLYILSKLKKLGAITEFTALKESEFMRRVEAENILTMQEIMACKDSLKEDGKIDVSKFGDENIIWHIFITGKGLEALDDSKIITQIKKWIRNPDNMWKIVLYILIPIIGWFILNKLLK